MLKKGATDYRSLPEMEILGRLYVQMEEEGGNEGLLHKKKGYAFCRPGRTLAVVEE